jgi:hypothetical protein
MSQDTQPDLDATVSEPEPLTKKETTMPGYLVRWSLLITADTPEAAAQQAAALVRDPAEPTTVFDVLSAHDWTPSGPGVLAQVSVPHPVVA